MKRTIYKYSRPIVKQIVNEFSGIIHSNLSSLRYEEVKNEISSYILRTSLYIPGFEFTFVDENLDHYSQINVVVSIDRTVNRSLKINSFRDFLYCTGCFRNIKSETESISCLFKSYSDIVKVVFIKTSSLESAYLYYSFGITSFLERMADYLGLVITKNGLYMDIKGELVKTLGLKQKIFLRSIYARVLLSDKIDKILEYLGINSQRYRNFSNSIKEVYDLIKESSYYTDSIFQNNKEIERLQGQQMITFHLFLLDDLNENFEFDDLLRRIKNANTMGTKVSPILYVKNDIIELNDL